MADADIIEDYSPFGHADYQGITAKSKKFASECKKAAVVSTINGDSSLPFYEKLRHQSLKATDCGCGLQRGRSRPRAPAGVDMNG